MTATLLAAALRRRPTTHRWRLPTLTLALVICATSVSAAPSAAAVSPPVAPETWLQQYCAKCHDDEQYAGGLSMGPLQSADLKSGTHTAEWELILRRTALGEMPPKDKPQPPAAERAAFSHWLEGTLDAYAHTHPDPGRATLRRLNRHEYANAVRDLLALNVDVSQQLPADDSGYGFDNIADVLTVSPTLFDRYLAVASRVSRLALGLNSAKPVVTSYTLPKEGSIKNQGIPSHDERMSDALPLNSRGGGAFDYYAAHDGRYEISGYLNANTNNEVDRLKENRVALSVTLKAGPHTLGMAFRRSLALDESVQTLRNSTDVIVLPDAPPVPLTLDFVVDGARVGQVQVPSYHMSPRFSQANFPRDVLQIDVEGPFDSEGAGDTPSRRKILLCTPTASTPEAACIRRIVSTLARQAYHRPVADADLEPLLRVYAQARADAGFEQAVSAVVEALLVSPQFLFVHEAAPAGSAPGTVHKLNDLQLATRLSLFLWSSLPDDTLLKLASRGTLHEPAMLTAQVNRMLDDPRANALTQNFAGQWLYLRNLEHQRPDVTLFAQFDTRLRQAMQRETELFFTSIVSDNRSVLDFLRADYTFLNERLAQHYGIDGIRGTAFRKVSLDATSQRGGLLGQASILTVTSYGNHTSVVKRGKWILDNLLASPPPAPPPDVPALQETLAGKPLNAREQLELHRSNASCASCHVKMDPLGFALENFDAIGRYRSVEAGRPLDVSAVLPDGTAFAGLTGLQRVLLERKDEFASAFTQRLLTYALARGLEPQDLPTVRDICKTAARDDYRIRSIILGIVQSKPFTLRRTPE